MPPSFRLLAFLIVLSCSNGFVFNRQTLMNRKATTQLASSSRGNRDPPFTHNTYIDLQDKDDEEASSASVSHEGSVVLKGGLGLGIIGGVIEQLVNGFKARNKYDSSFQTKISVELLVGFATQLAAEIGKRGSNSLAELDFIIAE